MEQLISWAAWLVAGMVSLPLQSTKTKRNGAMNEWIAEWNGVGVDLFVLPAPSKDFQSFVLRGSWLEVWRPATNSSPTSHSIPPPSINNKPNNSLSQPAINQWITQLACLLCCVDWFGWFAFLKKKRRTAHNPLIMNWYELRKANHKKREGRLRVNEVD